MRYASEGAPHGTVVIADKQTKGKGRLGRQWLSPPGENIYMSIVLRPELEPRDATLLTLLSAVAVARAIRNVSALPVGIKWPNDIMLQDKKLGGILLETRTDPDRIDFVVIGIGVNVNLRTKDLPSDVGGIATSMKEVTGKTFKRTAVTAEIMDELEREYIDLMNNGRLRLLKLWRELSVTLGREVRVTQHNKSLDGIAVDIDDVGMLIVKTADGKQIIVSSGDVSITQGRISV